MDALGAVLLIALFVAGVAWLYQKTMQQKCSACRSLVPRDATRCKHCQADL